MLSKPHQSIFYPRTATNSISATFPIPVTESSTHYQLGITQAAKLPPPFALHLPPLKTLTMTTDPIHGLEDMANIDLP
jgi:hypothetical protein